MTQSPTIYHILVAGTFSTGKTQFIQSISEIPVVATDRDITYIAYDFGRLTINPDLILFFFGAPVTRRIDGDYPINERCIGIVLMVESRYPETFRDTRSIMRYLSDITGLPMVIAANKQDLPDAWAADDVRIALRIPDEIPVIPCNARDKKSVATVLIALCQEILKRMEADEAET